MELRLLLLEALNGKEYAGPIHSVVLGIASLAFLAAALLPSLAGTIPFASSSRLGRRHFFYFTIVALIVWARLPGLLAPLLNPDEGIFTAAAVRLLHDPIFWRSVDTGSSGPLNVFPLMLPALAGFTLDFASSRLVGLVMITVSTCLLYAALSRVYSDSIARLAAMPIVTTIALMENPNFVHFSSEHVPVLLLSVMLLMLCGMRVSAGQHRPQAGAVFAIGFCAGLMPYTKMQGVPLAFALCLVLIHMLWLRHRHEHRQLIQQLGWLAAGAAVPSLVVAAYLSAFSIWDLFLHSYLQTNLSFYSGLNAGGTSSKLENFGALIASSRSLSWLAFIALVFSVFGSALYLLQRRKRSLQPVDHEIPPYASYAFVYLAAAALAAARPGNAFLHYLLFLIMPLGFLIGTIHGEIKRSIDIEAEPKSGLVRGSYLFLTLVLLMSAAIPVAARMKSGSHYLQQRSLYLQNYRGPVAEAILKIATPGSSMVVWGFSPNLYVESGLIQSTRYGFNSWQIEPNPLRSEFIEKYVLDLLDARPMVFVDAMSQTMFYTSPFDPAMRHDAIPAIAEVVGRHYEQVNEIQGVRLYRRKDKPQNS